MPRKPKDGAFDQSQYMNEWSKENMLAVSARYKKEFVEEFREALKTLGFKQSDVIRNMMQEIIEQAKDKK